MEKDIEGFYRTGFTWQAKDKGGRGAILHCPACGNATLIQFFHNISKPIYETCLRILSTFQDHATDDQVRWSLFDIRAVIPSQYKLARYRFEAGRYELNFVSRKETVALYRWGPASALLASEDLVAFAARTLEGQRSEWHPRTWSENPAVEWEKRFPAGLWARFGERLTGIRHYRKMRLWHLPDKNRIMGVAVRGNKPYPRNFLIHYACPMRVFRKKQGKPEITHAEAMRCIPVKSSLARETRLEGGLVQLAIPL